jgi:UDP-glucose 4-epimerase
MPVLVTGGAGYIGSAVVELLLARGEQVVVLDNLYRGHRQAVPAGVPFYEGTVSDAALIQRIVDEHRAEACVHFAALIEAGESVREPAKYFDNNTAQALALITALSQAGVKRFVFSSTAAVYGQPQRTPIDESHPLWPVNPYGWSKFMTERVLETFDRAYGMKFVALRYFNAAGAMGSSGEDHQPETHLIPNIIAAALGKREAVSVFGTDYATPDGTCVRDYIHVADLGSAHLLALDHLRAGKGSEFINLGNGRGYTVLQVIDAVKRVSGRDFRVDLGPRREGDPSHLVADSSKASRVLGWEPVFPSLDDIIGSAWRWHQSHPNGYNS